MNEIVSDHLFEAVSPPEMSFGTRRHGARPMPVYFAGCAGWVHPAGGHEGAILCGPIGQEELAVHRGWRSLAQMLSQSGLTTLRFDYPGTGDSAGDEADPDRLDHWVDSVVAAADWLRAHCGIVRISLVGLRLGAAIAALAAPRITAHGIDVERLVCLNPVVSGRNHLRELRLLASTWWAQAAPDLAPLETPEGCFDVVGYRWDTSSVAAVSALNLLSVQDWPRNVVLMDSTRRPEVASLAEMLRGRGVLGDELDFPGAADFLRDALLSVTPLAAFTTLCDLMARPLVPDLALRKPWSPPLLTLPEAVESPFSFGTDQLLHGIITRPSRGLDGTSDRAPGPVLLLLNTGRTHHVGHARLGVMLARALAPMGVTTLRMDTAGLGDSDMPDGEAGVLLHDLRTRAGIIAAIDALQRMGHRDITLMGLCSGGYQSFHTALADPRVGCVLAINTQKLVWMGGPSLHVSYDGNRRATGVYVRAALHWRNWARAARGEVKLVRIAYDLARRTVRSWRQALAQRMEDITGKPTEAGQVSRWIAALCTRGTRVRLIYSSADPGLADLGLHISPSRLMRRFANFTVEVVPRADHTLSSIAARDEVLQRVVAHFQQR